MRGTGPTFNKEKKHMQKKLYNVSPTHSHRLAGRVVSILKSGGLRDEPTLTRVHNIVERRANDPVWVKTFLGQLVDTRPSRMSQ